MPESPHIISDILTAFGHTKSLADRAIVQLPDNKLHISLHPETNSIDIIMKHLAGNLRSRWTDFLTTDGEKPTRDRDSEFTPANRSRAQSLVDWESVWQTLCATLESITPEDLSRTVTIRGEPHTVQLAAFRSLAHCGYHAGQIVMIARILAGPDWQTISIPRGGTKAHNQKVWSAPSYLPHPPPPTSR